MRRAVILVAVLLLSRCANVQAASPRASAVCESDLRAVAAYLASTGYMPAYVDDLLNIVDESRRHVARRPFAEPVPDLRFSGVFVWSDSSADCTIEITPRRDLADGRIEVLRVKLLVVKKKHEDVVAAVRELLRAAQLQELPPEALRRERYHWDDIVYDAEREMHVGFGVDLVPIERRWRGSLEVVRGGAVVVTGK